MADLDDLARLVDLHEAAIAYEATRRKAFQKEIGRALREARKARGAGMLEVGRKIKRTKYVLSNLELGRAYSTPAVRAAIKVLADLPRVSP